MYTHTHTHKMNSIPFQPMKIVPISRYALHLPISFHNDLKDQLCVQIFPKTHHAQTSVKYDFSVSIGQAFCTTSLHHSAKNKCTAVRNQKLFLY